MLSIFLYQILPAVMSVALLLRMVHRRIYRFFDRSPYDVVPYLRRVELEELHALFDPEEERHHRVTLARPQYRTLQWKRYRLALEKARDLAHNAVIVQEWAKYELNRSRRASITGLRESSVELIAACLQCRLRAFRVRWRLHASLARVTLVPFAPPPTVATLLKSGSLEMLGLYARVRGAAAELGKSYGRSHRERLMQSL